MKGIMFIEPLFHKVIKGGKTQTRRVMSPQPEIFFDIPIMPKLKLKYKLGEILYLKEPYVDDLIMEKTLFKYDKSDLQELIDNGYGDMVDSKGFWKNKLFMPQSAARHFIQITGIRAERLQDISDEDCIKEGIINWKDEKDLPKNSVKEILGFSDCFSWNNHSIPQDAYAALIDKITGRGTWDKDPWLWVYDFKYFNIK